MIIGVGMDLVEIERVERMLAARGDHMLRRLFLAAEAEYARTRARPAQHLAARLAAKEAAFKALSGTPDARAIGWRDIEVTVHDDGRPALLLHGRAAERAEALRVSRCWVSLSHSQTTAGAFVVIEGGSG
jgi:holo-[acyl-carrier protein] synthase